MQQNTETTRARIISLRLNAFEALMGLGNSVLAAELDREADRLENTLRRHLN